MAHGGWGMVYDRTAAAAAMVLIMDITWSVGS